MRARLLLGAQPQAGEPQVAQRVSFVRLVPELRVQGQRLPEMAGRGPDWPSHRLTRPRLLRPGTNTPTIAAVTAISATDAWAVDEDIGATSAWAAAR